MLILVAEYTSVWTLKYCPGRFQPQRRILSRCCPEYVTLNYCTVRWITDYPANWTGHMRCDTNISVTPPDSVSFGSSTCRYRIKNNSFFKLAGTYLKKVSHFKTVRVTFPVPSEAYDINLLMFYIAGYRHDWDSNVPSSLSISDTVYADGIIGAPKPYDVEGLCLAP